LALDKLVLLSLIMWSKMIIYNTGAKENEWAGFEPDIFSFSVQPHDHYATRCKTFLIRTFWQNFLDIINCVLSSSYR
jgi:hypothetical protein